MAARPNIVWIVTTQWRAQACGYAGDPNARTPCLDALARQSVNFVQAVTTHPFGPFARAAMLTGVPSPQNGVRDYFDPLPPHRRDVARGSSSFRAPGRTIAHDLAARGYATAFFGKWHLAKRDPRAPLVGDQHARTIVPPEARGGFEFWEGFEGGFLLNDPWLHGSRLPAPVRFAGYQSEVVGQRAAEWLAQLPPATSGSGRPFFAVVSLEPPHPPYHVSASTARARDPQELVLAPNVPRGNEVEARARRELAGYYAHIEATDRAIGELVETLDATAARLGERPPIVVFTSVHGDMHGAHGLFRKGWPYEESVRVPLLVRGEKPLAAGRQEPSALSLVELPAMTLRWADGHDAETAPSSFAQISMPSVVNLRDQCDRMWRGVRTTHRKLVLNADGSPWLFFDLEGDPGEMRNLVDDPARRREIAELRAAMGAS